MLLHRETPADRRRGRIRRDNATATENNMVANPHSSITASAIITARFTEAPRDMPHAERPAVAAPARYIPSREIMAARRQTASGGRSSRKPGAGAAGCGFGSAFMRSY